MDIKSLRHGRSWTQEQLAEHSGLSVRTVQRIERRGQASRSSYAALAAALEVPIAELMERAGPAPVLDRTIARRLGLVFGLPAIIFLFTNVLRYELGFETFPDLFTPLLRIRWLEQLSPFVFLGGCIAAVIINLLACVGFEPGRKEGATRSGYLVFFVFHGNLWVIILASGTFLSMLAYTVLENLSHLLSPG